MMLETFCTIILGLMLLMATIEDKIFKSKLLNKIINLTPKISGVLIFIYFILKYVFKLEG